MKTCCSKCALVICIGNRYFSHFGKHKSVQTAWSLAGAKLFLTDLAVGDVTLRLDWKKKKYEVKRVVVS